MIRAVLFIATITVSLTAFARLSFQEDEIRWLNPTSSPLSFDTRPNTRIAGIENKSRAEITAYQLGCVTVQNERLKVLSRYQMIEGHHLTPERMGMIPYDTLHKEWRDCSAKAGSLSAVEVRFADGAIWQIPNQ
jgi:hypothetical protein